MRTSTPRFFTPAAMHACQPYADHALSPLRLRKRSDSKQVATPHARRVHALYLQFYPATDVVFDLPTAEFFTAPPQKVARPANTPD